MTKTALEPCPSPWGKQHDLIVVYAPAYRWRDASSHVECSCGLRGPKCDTEAEAIAAWNQRTPVTDKTAQPVAWMPIETAPRDGTWVFCWGEDSDFGLAKFGPNPIWAEYPEYTHWMPLPPPPGEAHPPADPLMDEVREALFNAMAIIGHNLRMDATALVAGETLVAREVWKAGSAILAKLPRVDDRETTTKPVVDHETGFVSDKLGAKP